MEEYHNWFASSLSVEVRLDKIGPPHREVIPEAGCRLMSCWHRWGCTCLSGWEVGYFDCLFLKYDKKPGWELRAGRPPAPLATYWITTTTLFTTESSYDLHVLIIIMKLRYALTNGQLLFPMVTLHYITYKLHCLYSSQVFYCHVFIIRRSTSWFQLIRISQGSSRCSVPWQVSLSFDSTLMNIPACFVTNCQGYISVKYDLPQGDIFNILQELPIFNI